MLSALIVVPLVAAAVLALARGLPDHVVRIAWVVSAAVLLALAVAATATFVNADTSTASCSGCQQSKSVTMATVA